MRLQIRSSGTPTINTSRTTTTSTTTTTVAAALLILLSPTIVSAHSWLDCSDTRDTGCAGYPRGYPSRNDADINTKYTYLIQDRNPDAPVCQPGRQNVPGNNPFPPAGAAPGQTLHLTWQPDGHLDDSRPSLVEVHWTGVPGQQLGTRSQLTPATLLGAMTFATSQNCNKPTEPNTWCHGYLTIPPGTQPGTYQMVWWWKFDRNPHGEEYSTCFEVVVQNPMRRRRRRWNRLQSRQDRPDETTFATPNEASSPLPHEVVSVPAVPAVSAAPISQVSDALNGGNSDRNRLRHPTSNDYANDKIGALAGDAINDGEGLDTAPEPMASPSQLITNTLSDHLSTGQPAAPGSSSPAPPSISIPNPNSNDHVITTNANDSAGSISSLKVGSSIVPPASPSTSTISSTPPAPGLDTSAPNHVVPEDNAVPEATGMNRALFGSHSETSAAAMSRFISLGPITLASLVVITILF
ncbi:hypothetical protein BGW38_001585 [Lunasporangiospora selenospora]|uniref:Chitin-binding protein n=1 Tax=Lunasporangiospora selenospora TaxID=979761 RepID=A0A9P6KE53_9FUNG|nr:hypothetical protein BGW38_001585 [Lunasporangiospora selenospora]